MTQADRILAYMREHGSITQREADRCLGVQRLGARIWDLRHAGVNIVKETASGKNRFGETTYFARYRLED